jgi:hypothetical protein
MGKGTGYCEDRSALSLFKEETAQSRHQLLLKAGKRYLRPYGFESHKPRKWHDSAEIMCIIHGNHQAHQALVKALKMDTTYSVEPMLDAMAIEGLVEKRFVRLRRTLAHYYLQGEGIARQQALHSDYDSMQKSQLPLLEQIVWLLGSAPQEAVEVGWLAAQTETSEQACVQALRKLLEYQVVGRVDRAYTVRQICYRPIAKS